MQASRHEAHAPAAGSPRNGSGWPRTPSRSGPTCPTPVLVPLSTPGPGAQGSKGPLRAQEEKRPQNIHYFDASAIYGVLRGRPCPNDAKLQGAQARLAREATHSVTTAKESPSFYSVSVSNWQSLQVLYGIHMVLDFSPPLTAPPPSTPDLGMLPSPRENWVSEGCPQLRHHARPRAQRPPRVGSVAPLSGTQGLLRGKQTH